MRHHMKIVALMLAAGAITPAISNSAAHYWLQQKVDFIRDIQPVFQANCYQCHGSGKGQSQLRLVNKALAMKVIVPGNSRDSRLMHRILGLGGEAPMPMGGEPLKPGQIDLIRTWIDQGAEWPESASVDLPAAAPRHWAYVAPSRPPLPAVENKAWSKNPIDGFILAQLKSLGLAPSPEADKETLIRRLSLDLTGLPPTIEEVDQFLCRPEPRRLRETGRPPARFARITASAGGDGGSTPRATPTPTASKKTARARSGLIATG